MPIRIDLLPELKKYNYNEGTFTQSIDAQPGMEFNKDVEDFKLPDEDGYTVSFQVPNLPANPKSMTLDYKVGVGYQIKCAEDLGGNITAQVYLAGDSHELWSSPLNGATTSATIDAKGTGTLDLEGSAKLTDKQLNAVLNGSLVLGLRLKTQGLTGKVSENCNQVQITGKYTIDKAMIEIRFF